MKCSSQTSTRRFATLANQLGTNLVKHVTIKIIVNFELGGTEVSRKYSVEDSVEQGYS